MFNILFLAMKVLIQLVILMLTIENTESYVMLMDLHVFENIAK